MLKLEGKKGKANAGITQFKFQNENRTTTNLSNDFLRFKQAIQFHTRNRPRNVLQEQRKKPV